jgi:dynein heavy chain
LIESLEQSKVLSTEIKEKVEIAKVTEVDINVSSEFYRPAANRGALVFFLMNELNKIHSYYKFSLDSFLIVVTRAIDLVAKRDRDAKLAAKKAEEGGDDEDEGEEGEGEGEAKAADKPAEEAEEEKLGEMTPRTLQKRVNDLIESITYQGFNYTRRGTLEDDKLIISTMLTFRILIRKGIVVESEYAAMIKRDLHPDPPHQSESLKFLTENIWAAVKGLEGVKLFENLIGQMEGEALLWRKWYMDEKPEVCDLPKSVANISLFHRMLLLRAMRPDRLTYALKEFVTEYMGLEYIEQPPFDIDTIVDELNP